MKNTFLICLITMHCAFAQSLTTLELCQDKCNCKFPKLKEEVSFFLTETKTDISVTKCSHNLQNLFEILDCATMELISTTTKTNSCDSSKSSPQKITCDIESLYGVPATIAMTKGLKGCGYYRSRSRYMPKSIERFINNFSNKGEVKCTPTMCTTVTFLALISHAKRLLKSGKINQSKYEELIKPKGKAYKMLTISAEPNRMVETMGIGKGFAFNGNSEQLGKNNIPAPGDIVQFWRKNGSGHSVVFKGFLDQDQDGKKDLICYWSSQGSTSGFGNVCEKIDTINKVLVGHLSK